MKQSTMGRRTERPSKSHTLPPSPSHSFSSSSSSDFEFTISISPRKSSTTLCPADELFYKGQLLPLHLSPRLSMVGTLLLASSSTSSSSDTTTTASRDSTGSSNDSHSSFNSDLLLLAECDSSRPSSVTEDDEFKRLHNPSTQIKKPKYFSLSRFSSVFKKDPKTRDPDNVSGSSVKRMSSTAKEVIRKYMKKVKPLYEKLSQKQQQQQQQQQKMGGGGLVTTSSTAARTVSLLAAKEHGDKISTRKESVSGLISQSFSGNLRYPRRNSRVSSCPSSMRSSPSHSGVLSRTGFMGTSRVGGGMYNSDTSSMEELQSAIQGAIAHCKNSMIQNKTMLPSTIKATAIIKRQPNNPLIKTHRSNNDIKQQQQQSQQQRSSNSDPLKDSAIDSPIFHNNNHNNNDTSFSVGDDAFASQPVSEIYINEAISEDFDGGFPRSDGSILPPLMEMEPEEGFTLRE